MIRNIFIVAALLAPAIAHAESIVARRAPMTRVQPAHKTIKPERVPNRIAVRETAPLAVTARGLDVQDVLNKLNGAYMTGLQRCYRKHLAIDPTLSGKIDLQFTIDESGNVTSDLQGDGVVGCVAGLMLRWRFGVALNDRAEPTATSFRISLMLQKN